MPEARRAQRSPAATATVILAVLAVFFAMREVRTVVVPALLAFFLAAVADLPVAWLQRKGLNRILCVILVVTGMTLAAIALGIVVGSSVQELSEKAPELRQMFRDQLDEMLEDLGGPQVGNETVGILDYISPDAALGLAAGVLTSVRDLLGSAILILFLMVFMLFEVPTLTSKLEVLGASTSDPSFPEIVRGYLGIKTLTSVATGALVGLFLVILGVDFAGLWGLLAFLLNYIPSIGSFVAAVPAVFVTQLQNGPGMALLVAAGYLLINLAIGNGLEPRILGQGFGLSTLVVFLSLILWGWLLGPVGMLLSTPLTTTAKIALARRRSTRPIAVLLGRDMPPELDPEPPVNPEAEEDSDEPE